MINQSRMNIIPDVLTSSRGVMAIFILLLGVLQGENGLPTIIILTIACWVTDVLDGKLARQSTKPTRLGGFDPIADWVLAASIALCLVLWKVIPWFVVVIVMGIVTFSTRLLHFVAPQKFFIGLTYGVLFVYLCQKKPVWAVAMVGSLVLLVILNPPRAKQQVRGFFREIAEFIRGVDKGNPED